MDRLALLNTVRVPDKSGSVHYLDEIDTARAALVSTNKSLYVHDVAWLLHPRLQRGGGDTSRRPSPLQITTVTFVPLSTMSLQWAPVSRMM